MSVSSSYSTVRRIPLYTIPFRDLVKRMRVSNWSRFIMELYNELSKEFMVDYDETGSIGKRYRRQDEIGTPFCITLDFETVGDENTPADHCVTIRERDTMNQVRIPIDQVKSYLEEKIKF